MQHLLFTLMFSVPGVCLISALDSTMIFFLPLAVDFGLIFITSRNPSLFWLYPILLAACSLVGAAVTFYLGRTIGEAGLEHFISSRRLERVKARLKGNRAVAIAALDLLPPPFPFTPFILAAGAFKVNVRRFFIAMFAFRLVRFGAEAVLAAVYGRHLVRWMESDWFRYIAYFFTAIVLVGSVFTVIQFVRKTRGRRSPSQASGLSMKTSAVLCVLLFVVIATNANAQQPFYTDDAGVTDVGDLHLELNNEFDILQHSAYPNLRQDTTVYRFFYGLVPRLEVSIDSPLIGIFNATGAAYRRPFGPGDTNFAAKYNFREERQGSAVPALTLSMNVEVPTGDAKRQLGSGLVDYWLYGVAQKAISDRTVIHANGGILFAGNTSTGVLGIQTRGTAFTAGLSVVRAFQPRLKLGAEIYAAVSPNLALRRGQLQMLMGGNYEIRKDTTFDFGLIGGKFPASPRVGVQFGFTTTWHSNRSVPRKVMAFTRVDRRE